MLGGRSSGGTIGTGGITGLGGSSSVGGVIVTGGVIGAVATGGIVGTGGATISGCGTTKSTVAQTFNFAAGVGTLALGPGSVSGAQVKYATSGPAAKPALCSSTFGCAALSVPFVSGAAAYTPFAMAVENFAPAISLVGSTVTFSMAVDNPGTTQVPIQIQAYSQGDATATYAWTKPVTVGGSSLDAYAAATGFKDLTLPVTDYVSTTGKYCAAVAAAIGIEVMNTAAITSSNAGTVTIYISKITVTPPP
jgi:roadblock/LC7 domain-containing protein